MVTSGYWGTSRKTGELTEGFRELSAKSRCGQTAGSNGGEDEHALLPTRLRATRRDAVTRVAGAELAEPVITLNLVGTLRVSTALHCEAVELTSSSGWRSPGQLMD